MDTMPEQHGQQTNGNGKPRHLIPGTDGVNYWIYERLPSGELTIVTPKTPLPTTSMRAGTHAELAQTLAGLGTH